MTAIQRYLPKMRASKKIIEPRYSQNKMARGNGAATNRTKQEKLPGNASEPTPLIYLGNLAE